MGFGSINKFTQNECDEVKQYSRQVLYRNIGTEGQKRVMEATVLIIGAGALGSVSSEMLSRAGVKKIILVDRDYVEASNLQRQTLFSRRHAREKTPKAVGAKERLLEVRPDLELDVHIGHCDGPLLESLAEEVDIILDGTDNFDTRLLINDVAWKFGLPWVFAACVEASYSSCGFVPKATPCYRCLVPVLPSSTLTCDTAGIIAPAVQMAVSEQVTTALKILTGQYHAPHYMRIGDIWESEHSRFCIDRMKEETCPTCGGRPTYPALSEPAGQTMRLCGRDTIQVMDARITKASVDEAVDKMGIKVNRTPYFSEFYYDDARLVCFDSGRILIHDTGGIDRARTLVDQLFG